MSIKEMQERIASKIQEKVSLIRTIANKLVGTCKPHEYGNVVLQVCIIKRFFDVLALTRRKMLDTNAQLDKRSLVVKAGFLTQASGFDFYNLSPFTLEGLLSDDENIIDNFRSYQNRLSCPKKTVNFFPSQHLSRQHTSRTGRGGLIGCLRQ